MLRVLTANRITANLLIVDYENGNMILPFIALLQYSFSNKLFNSVVHEGLLIGTSLQIRRELICSKNIFSKMLEDVGMEVPKSRETSRPRQGMIVCNGCNPFSIYRCRDMVFGTSLPTSFNILLKMFLLLFRWFYCV